MLSIYGFPLSSPTNKVRYVANYLGLNFDFKQINLGAGEHLTPEYLKINPFAKIPAIDDEGFILVESNAIIRYLANKHNSVLYPTDIKERAIVDKWIDYATQHVSIPFSKIMYNTYFYRMAKVEQDLRSLQDGYNFINKSLPNVEHQLSNSEYIAGDTMTLADCVLLSALDVAQLSKIDLAIYPHITKWHDKLISEAFYTKVHKSYTDVFNQMV